MPEESGEVTAENLLAAAQEFDAAVAAGEQPNVEIKTEEPEPEKEETPPEEPTETAEAEPDSEQQNVDEPESSLTEGETPEEEDESQKSKWAKNESRKNKSWKEINSQKEAIKKEREELEAMKGELQEKQTDMDEGKAYRDKDGFTAADYERAADRAEEDGDYSDAEAARARAKELAGEGKKAESDRTVKKFQDAFEKTRDELMEEIPSLKETDSALTKESNQILKEHPDLIYASEGTGLRHAVKIAQWKIAASKTDKSQAEVKELTDKLNKLEKKMSVGGGFTSDKLDGDRTFDDLSMEDQESYLLKAAAAHDDAL
tara:strand:+ start:481 stop:1431 length:951 start_codon:yes stop_codon:yes gene_type:complete